MFYIKVYIKVIDQMFLTIRDAVSRSLRATFGVAFVFIHVVSPSGFCFGVNLDYLDFSGGIFDL